MNRTTSALRGFGALCASILWLSLGLLLFTAGCPGTLTEEEKKMLQGGVACPDDMVAFLGSKCGAGPCHGNAAPGGGLDLVSAGVENRLISVPGSANCNGAILANPLDPANSLLHLKLQNAPPCGSRMPFGTPLTDAEIQCVSDWIGTLTPTNTGAGGAGGMGGAGAGAVGGAGGTGGI